MEFFKEYAAGAGFPVDLTFSCFFQTVYCIYGLAVQRKQIYKNENGNTEAVELIREYRKIVPNLKEQDFFAYIQMKPGSDINIYHLDKHFKEFDFIKLKKAEGYYSVQDIWFDGVQEFLFLIYSGSILKYNCNGDFLGCFLSAPLETTYCAMCTCNELVFIAYKKRGCAYVAMYTYEGRYKERISLGNEYEIYGMQVIEQENYNLLRLYVSKTKTIQLFLELKIMDTKQPETPLNTSCPCSLKGGNRTDGIKVELVRGDGIGETTCYLEPSSHTYELAT